VRSVRASARATIAAHAIGSSACLAIHAGQAMGVQPASMSDWQSMATAAWPPWQWISMDCKDRTRTTTSSPGSPPKRPNASRSGANDSSAWPLAARKRAATADSAPAPSTSTVAIAPRPGGVNTTTVSVAQSNIRIGCLVRSGENRASGQACRSWSRHGASSRMEDASAPSMTRPIVGSNRGRHQDSQRHSPRRGPDRPRGERRNLPLPNGLGHGRRAKKDHGKSIHRHTMIFILKTGLEVSRAPGGSIMKNRQRRANP